MNDIHEVRANDTALTNHQRIKDREIDRAYRSRWGTDIMLLPTRSRMRRMGLTIQKLIAQAKEQQDGDVDGLPVHNP